MRLPGFRVKAVSGNIFTFSERSLAVASAQLQADASMLPLDWPITLPCPHFCPHGAECSVWFLSVEHVLDWKGTSRIRGPSK